MRRREKMKKVKLIARQIGGSSVVKNLCVVVLYIISTIRPGCIVVGQPLLYSMEVSKGGSAPPPR